MTWQAGFWWWGLAALAVPIAVHLWSRAAARRLRVGSVALFAPAASRRARRLRLTDALLLALRCLLVAAVVLALAGPRLPPATAAEWGLVEALLVAQRRQLEALDPQLYARLDAVAAAGRLRLLAPSLPRLGAADGGGVAGDLPPADLWSLLREAEARLAPRRLEVFASDRLAVLAGERPALAAAVDVHLLPLPGTARWIARAAAGEGGVALAVATSRAGGTAVEHRRYEGAGEAGGV
ncbi:MAG: hypothetical protein D6696_07620, partial [Acidobacteria bacterium]